MPCSIKGCERLAFQVVTLLKNLLDPRPHGLQIRACGHTGEDAVEGGVAGGFGVDDLNVFGVGIDLARQGEIEKHSAHQRVRGAEFTGTAQAAAVLVHR